VSVHDDRARRIAVTDPAGLARLEAKQGFRDVHFDDDARRLAIVEPAAWREFVGTNYFVAASMIDLGDDSDRVEWFRRKDDALDLGPARLDGVFYGLLNGHVLRFVVRVRGEENCRLFRIALEEAYGRPTDPGEFSARRWQSSTVDMDLSGYKNDVCHLVIGRKGDAAAVHAAAEAALRARRREQEEREAKAREASKKL
jgi:hypothetical protein